MSNTSKHIGWQIKTVSNLIKRHLDNSAARKEADSVTGTNVWVIFYLFHHGKEDVYQRDLEHDFSVRRSTMSNVLGLMERKGLITRESVPHDARLKKIVPTARAYELHEMMEKDREETEALVTAGLTEEELEAFVATLSKIRKNLEDSDGPCEAPHRCRRRKDR